MKDDNIFVILYAKNLVILSLYLTRDLTRGIIAVHVDAASTFFTKYIGVN